MTDKPIQRGVVNPRALRPGHEPEDACPECDGKGKDPEGKACVHCEGTGRTKETTSC